MANSKLLQWAEENAEIKVLIKGCFNKHKISGLILRQKAIAERVKAYGKRGNLYLVEIGPLFRFFFTDILEEDIPFLVDYYKHILELPANLDYKFEKLPLGQAIPIQGEPIQ